MRRIALAASAGSLMLSRTAWSLTRRLAKALPIAALVPRDASGHHFVLFSDCTVTGEDKGSSDALHNIGLVVQRLVPSPEFISFPGDAVGSGDNEKEWEFFREELKWSREEGIAVYQSTSNHTAYSFKSEARFREFNQELPLNGPGDERGLAYWVRRGNLLYVSLHHPASSTRYRAGYDFGDMTWLEDVLARNSDAEYRLVVGHYPVFRVNGYTEMSIPHADWGPFWATLRKHRVDAYLTSHVLAFDVQVHDGILQICSGGAGPGAMPPATEGTHAVQIAIDRQGIRFQVLNIEGRVRESLVWPFQPSRPDEKSSTRIPTSSARLAIVE